MEGREFMVESEGWRVQGGECMAHGAWRVYRAVVIYNEYVKGC